MAKVWFVYEGPKPTRGDAAYELPAKEAVQKLGVRSENFLSDLDKPPRFNKQSTLGEIAGYRHVVLELESAEATVLDWRAGFYLIEGTPQDVIALLGAPKRPFPNGGEGATDEEPNE